MKTIKLFLKAITYLLVFLILFQDCTVYKSKPVTLEYASEIGEPVRIEKTDGKKLKLLKVAKWNDGNYYGDRKEKEFVKHILINEEEISKVEIKDKKWSTINSIAASTAIIGILIIAVAKGLESMPIM